MNKRKCNNFNSDTF